MDRPPTNERGSQSAPAGVAPRRIARIAAFAVLLCVAPALAGDAERRDLIVPVAQTGVLHGGAWEDALSALFARRSHAPRETGPRRSPDAPPEPLRTTKRTDEPAPLLPATRPVRRLRLDVPALGELREWTPAPDADAPDGPELGPAAALERLVRSSSAETLRGKGPLARSAGTVSDADTATVREPVRSARPRIARAPQRPIRVLRPFLERERPETTPIRVARAAEPGADEPQIVLDVFDQGSGWQLSLQSGYRLSRGTTSMTAGLVLLVDF